MEPDVPNARGEPVALTRFRMVCLATFGPSHCGAILLSLLLPSPEL